MSVLLSGKDLTKSYAHKALFTGLCVDLRVGEKVGLIGPNGAGKSTLLKILAGIEVPDDGERSVRRGARIGYLPQDDRFPEGLSAREIILETLASDSTLEDHERETRTAIALTQVGLTDDTVLPSALSGGWKKRLALARELATRPDFLLMDEPTNHLDLPGVLWLEKLLRAAPFGYLAATHDRAFLRAIAQDILEVSRVYPEGIFRADGGYDSFADKREAFLEAQERQRESVANQVRRETEWLGRKESAQRKKSRSRIEEAAQRRAELGALTERSSAAGVAAIDFAGTGRQTRKLLVAQGLAKSFGSRSLFANLDLILGPGMRIGLLGVNGSGKSTLLNILSGRIAPDAGTVTRADGLRVEVFEQGRSSLDQSQTLRRALCPNGDTVIYRDQPIHVGGWARRFLFHSDQLELELSALSGGEQARVRIAQLMVRPADLLFLDEPTNDLDLAALEVLEESLEEFPGAVVLVSHDRELMDRLCTSVIGLDNQGGWGIFANVNQWLASLDVPAEKPARPEAKPAPAAPPARGKKLSYKEQQEFESMEAAILAGEERVAAQQAAVETAATAGHAALSAACAALEEAQRNVERLYARWQELEAKRTGSATT